MVRWEEQAIVVMAENEITPPELIKSPSASTSETKSCSSIDTDCFVRDVGEAAWRELGLIYFAIISDAMASSIMVSYVAKWLRDDFLVLDNVGFYGGLLIGIMNFAGAFSSPFLGWCSDVMGRPAVIVFGLLAVGTFSLIGAVVDSYWLSLCLHGFAGLFDGVQTAATAAIGDLSKGSSRQIAFGYSAASYQVARILSSVIGGFLYGVDTGDLFLRQKISDPEDHNHNENAILSHVFVLGLCVASAATFLLYRSDPFFDDDEYYDTDIENKTIPMKIIDCGENKEERIHDAPPPYPSFFDGLRYVAGEPILVRLIAVYTFLQFLNGQLLMAIPLLAESTHGFNMSASETGVALMLFGIYCIIFNFTVFRLIVTRLGQKRANALGFILTAVGLLGLPLTQYLTAPGSTCMWVGICCSYVIFGTGYMMLSCILTSLISTHASPHYQGVTQGVTRMLASIARGIGPMVEGAMFEWSININLISASFFFISAGYIGAMFILAPIPRDVLERRKI